ncbi:DUF106 domain-containing protein [Candidatus Woesearchaeota archaeon]|nr:DUF106 domain-containing protein [Candidatus Woesearchaeota archaeon]
MFSHETMLNSILDVLLGWLLNLPPLAGIVIIAFIISLLVTLVYRLVTNQDLMKDLRDEQKALQKEIKKLKDKPDKAMKVQSEMMETNLKYMSHSMKPTLFTFIPIILIFGWLNSHMAYYELSPNVPFEVDVFVKEGISGEIEIGLPDGLELTGDDTVKEIVNNQATYHVKGEAGEYNISFNFNDETASKQILISNERRYYSPEKQIKDSSFEKIVVGNEKVKPFNGLPLIGNLGWLGGYIIFSIIFSMTLRRVLKIY